MNSNREPSSNYLSISFSLLAIMQVISITLSSVFLLTISLHRHLCTVSNLLTANSSVAVFIFAQMIIGFQPIYPRKGRACILLSYLTCVQYLLIFPVHEFIILLSWCISCLLLLFLYLQGTCKVFLEEMTLIKYSR